MKTDQQRMEHVIRETVTHYESNPRAVSGARCVYYKPADGAMCAVGRCMYKRSLDRLKKRNILHNGISQVCAVLGVAPDDLLKSKYQGLSPEFWKALQALHDDDEYWVSTGPGTNRLTPTGEDYRDVLLQRFGGVATGGDE